jgi:hypothetical protein
MDDVQRHSVRQRAGNRCEYCRLRQGQFPFGQFHIEHIVPRKHGGTDDVMNLALACHHCNLHKGTNVAGFDPQTGEMTPLFHPRKQRWSEHFAMAGGEIVGLTAIGRTTVEVLVMNAPGRIRLRIELGVLGESGR